MSEEAGLIANPMVWYAGAVAVFFLGIFHYARKPILGMLDAEIAKIKDELEEAKKLRAEAAATLDSFRVRHKEALAEAEAIIEQAKKDAARLKTAAETDMQATLAKHEQKVAERIQLAETEAVAEVRAAVIAEAMTIVRSTMVDRLDHAAINKLAEEAVADSSRLTPSSKSKTA